MATVFFIYYYPVKQKLCSGGVKHHASVSLYIILVQPGDLDDVFNFRWGQNFFWCQTGSRREPLSWLLHLLYIFITGLFSSCPVPTHMYKEENPHPPKHAAKIPYVHTSRPCTFHKSVDDRDRKETRVWERRRSCKLAGNWAQWAQTGDGWSPLMNVHASWFMDTRKFHSAVYCVPNIYSLLRSDI